MLGFFRVCATTWVDGDGEGEMLSEVFVGVLLAFS